MTRLCDRTEPCSAVGSGLGPGPEDPSRNTRGLHTARHNLMATSARRVRMRRPPVACDVIAATMLVVASVVGSADSATSEPAPATIIISTGTAAGQVRPQFMSTTIDVSLLSHTEHCDLTSPRLRTMAKAIGPTWMRVGGTKADKLWYDMSESPQPPPNSTLYSGGTFNRSVWDSVNEFAADVGFSIVFGINAGPGPRGGNGTAAWDPSNALALMDYTRAKGYPVVGYEFGNEPGVFCACSGKRCALRVCHYCGTARPHRLTSFVSAALRSRRFDRRALVNNAAAPCFPGAADQFPTVFNWSVPANRYVEDTKTFVTVVKGVDKDLLTVAPDMNFIPIVGDYLMLESMLPYANHLAITWDVVSWHFYPTFAPEHFNKHNLPWFLQPLISAPSLLLEPSVLDRVGQDATSISKLTAANVPGAEVWLGETGSAVGGGAANVSNAFVDGFEYLDKLGQMALRGNSLVFRQTLCGYRYGLVDFELNPMPSFFVSVLFKRLIGETALATTVSPPAQTTTVRAYTFCGRGSGTVTVLINLSNTTDASVALDVDPSAAPGAAAGSERHDYVLTAFDTTHIEMSQIYLNGAVLDVAVDGSVPAMEPVVVTPSGGSKSLPPVALPRLSYGFFALPGASAVACKPTSDESRT